MASLRPIVAALGGDLYRGGLCANVPAPGHSAADRSISLMISGDRLIIHGFADVDWRTMRDELRRLGLIDDQGRVSCVSAGIVGGPSLVRPDRGVRLRTAARLWEAGRGIGPGMAASRYLRRRGAPVVETINLRHHPEAPLSVYRPGRHRRPALMARISDADDRITAVELTYLETNGRPAPGLRVGRKTVGLVPAGAAVRLARASEEMLVAEGVLTTLSAMARFDLPGWALMAAHNLAAWSPPAGVRRVLIAADRGRVGEAAADRLRHRLRTAGLVVAAVWPDPPFGDWNEAGTASRRMEEGG